MIVQIIIISENNNNTKYSFFFYKVAIRMTQGSQDISHGNGTVMPFCLLQGIEEFKPAVKT